ncbi:MAG: recombination mediator protein UvsY [Bacilli bacterium]|nr:recombination mediator protein UvsY [Bacilli bacterium]
MTLDEIKLEWSKDSKIDENNIGLESIKTSSYHAKYLNEQTNHKMHLIKLQSELIKAKRIKVKYFDGLMDKEELETYGLEQYQGKKMLKSQMDEFLAGDKDLILINIKIECTKIIINYLDAVLKNLYNRNYEISNFTNNRKFEAGF